jgi:Tripartite tricarboxylate transporter family receptor
VPPADGYTLLFVSGSQAINASLYDNLPFDFLRDFVPVASATLVPLVMVVNLSVPAKTVAEFIELAKSRPGARRMASFGTGSPSHLAGELFKAMAGVDMIHVPYRGSAGALTDLMSGRVEVMFDTLLASGPHIRSGALRLLAMTGKASPELAPGVPTLPGYDADGWQGARRAAGYVARDRRAIERRDQRQPGGTKHPLFKMMDVSRHKSVDVLRGYVRDAEAFRDHAGAGLLQSTGALSPVAPATSAGRRRRSSRTFRAQDLAYCWSCLVLNVPDAAGRNAEFKRPRGRVLRGGIFFIEASEKIDVHGLFSVVSRTSDLVALALPEQLRQSRNIDGDPPRLVLRQHLRLQSFGRVVARVQIRPAPGRWRRGRRSRRGWARRAMVAGSGVGLPWRRLSRRVAIINAASSTLRRPGAARRELRTGRQVFH